MEKRGDIQPEQTPTEALPAQRAKQPAEERKRLDNEDLTKQAADTVQVKPQK